MRRRTVSHKSVRRKESRPMRLMELERSKAAYGRGPSPKSRVTPSGRNSSSARVWSRATRGEAGLRSKIPEKST